MIISTWILIATITGVSPSSPYRTITINDMPTIEECKRVGNEIANRLYASQSLCIEVKKVKP